MTDKFNKDTENPNFPNYEGAKGRQDHIYAPAPLEEEEDIKEDRKKDKKKKKKTRPSYGSVVALALVFGILGGFLGQYLGGFLAQKDQGLVEKPGRELVINPKDDNYIASAVAQANMSSVVGITTVELVSDYYFFLPREVEGVGSGVIVDSRGFILTNSHVVGDGKAKSLEVLFEDGEKIPGQVLWNSTDLDLALVKVDKTGLPAVQLGDSDELKVGEPAIAIGNPLGLDFQRSVTAGIISGLNRTISVNNITMNDLIQTDASINKGNSGGPLFNAKGEVIGINTVKVGNAEGLGFSIPINQTKSIIKQVVEKGDFSPVALGIKGYSAEEFALRYNLDFTDKGIIVMEINPSGPGSKAGLKQFDLITHIDGKPVENVGDLNGEIQKFEKGDRVSLDIIRSDEKLKIEVEF